MDINSSKNNKTTIERRKTVSKLIVACFIEEKILVSIDETSFSPCDYKYRGWAFSNSSITKKEIMDTPHKNISLLMGVSSEMIEAITLVEGGVNQIVFANFLVKMVGEIIARRKCQPKDIVILLDNLRAHKTFLIKCIFVELGVSFIFNAPYSPELNFIEKFLVEYNKLFIVKIEQRICNLNRDKKICKILSVKHL